MFLSSRLPSSRTYNLQTRSRSTPQSIHPDKKKKKKEEEEEDEKHLFLMAASKAITGSFEKWVEVLSSVEKRSGCEGLK